MEYRRPPDRIEHFRQELLGEEEGVLITLSRLPRDAGPLRVGPEELPGGSSVLWFTFPGRWYEVAALYGPDEELRGHYANLVRPPARPEGRRWSLTDLFLDLWTPPDGPTRVLDRQEFEEARREGWIGEDDAAGAERACREILRRAREGTWPPPEVRRWTLETVPALRLRRDEPGTYYANLVSSRIIAWGIYCLGLVALTSVGFAALTDVFAGGEAARMAWLAVMGVEATALLPFALAGKLPAARRVRTHEVLTEHTLFLAAAVSAAAILAVHDSSLWRSLLSSVYATLGLFLGIFAACRAWFDRALPRLALAGLAVCLLAMLFLL